LPPHCGTTSLAAPAPQTLSAPGDR
jgi:hypothetical protein